MMGAPWIIRRITTIGIIVVLQIKGLLGNKYKALTGVEGRSFDFICDYQGRGFSKYFRLYDNSTPLIWTDKLNEWVRKDRFSLYDNTTGAFFIVRVDELVPKDGGTYLCGVHFNGRPDDISIMDLNVTQVGSLPESLKHNGYSSVSVTMAPAFYEMIIVDKHNLPVFLTVVMCVAAILFVCLFTLCLMWAIKHQRAAQRQNREPSSDYEIMMPSVTLQNKYECVHLGPLPAPPQKPDLCPHLSEKQRESVLSNLSDYTDVDPPKHSGQYQHLDRDGLECHVYHSLHQHIGSKDGPQEDKGQTHL